MAWVNLLSIYALANFPPHGTFSASKAAAHSLAQCLRAEMRPAGVRVVNVFPGPIDDEWNQLLPPPKLAPAALAAAILKALREGVEDVYPGDLAQEWLERWRDNPKEALKGLPYLTESFDENGVYLSTTHHQYHLRRRYTGLDGREVRYAFQSGTRTFLYDNAPFTPTTSTTQSGAEFRSN